jgi:1-acyl-sn-glycerol-3-phosphate acyltransferase
VYVVLVRVPELGPAIPRQGSALSAAIGRALLAAGGWRIEGEMPDVGKAVIIVAPHTSNWDFVWGAAAKLALRLRVRFLGKHTLFNGPLAPLMRWLGGIPVDRRSAAGVVEQTLAALSEQRQLVLAVAPEGTRRKVAAWKSGFYRIAVGAAIPIIPVALDYRKRAVVFEGLFEPTGDYAADLPRIQELFSAQMARRPELY